MQIVEQNKALKLEALRDFVDEKNNAVRAGEEWLFVGPGTYYPRVEVLVNQEITAFVIKE